MIGRTLFILTVSIAVAVGMFTGYSFGSERSQLECQKVSRTLKRTSADDDVQPDERRTSSMGQVD